jgi:hypothetical protein
MRAGIGGHEMLAVYAEGIAKMPENPGIPVLFRDIFKNAYLPYRDPETLKAFLKIIDEFNYDHSERLGDAFEYLLSVLGSQGDAGQFRTPRHYVENFQIPLPSLELQREIVSEIEGYQKVINGGRLRSRKYGRCRATGGAQTREDPCSWAYL